MAAVCLLLAGAASAMAQALPGTPVIRANGETSANGIFSYLAGDPVQITLTSSFDGEEIWYTTDGSEPGLFSGALYRDTGPFRVTPPATIRAIAYTADWVEVSDEAVARLLFQTSFTLADLTQGAGGGVQITPLSADYPSGTSVSLIATNLPGWQFMRWAGDFQGTNPVATVVMNTNKSIRAIFGTTIQASVTGQGSVMAEPAAGPYEYGSLVRLMAIPNPGRTFARWTNSAAMTNGLITVQVTNAQPAFRAVFGIAVPAGSSTLTLKVSGQGTLDASPLALYHRSGTIIEVRPRPDPGWVFDGWTGDATGAPNPLFTTLTTNKVITAIFVPRPADEPVLEGLDLWEYFVDTDPGEGKGTRFRHPGGERILVGELDIDIAGLGEGLHRVGFRARDEQRRWTDTQWCPIQVESRATVESGVGWWTATAPQSWLAAAEYFWDADPGAGAGTTLPLERSESWTLGQDIPVQQLTPGIHRLGCRVRDATGQWSATQWTPVEVALPANAIAGVDRWPSAETNRWLSAVEYFLDQDPGPGAGTTLLAEPGESWTGSIDLPVTGFSNGTHQLGFRIRDASNRWSTVQWIPIQVEGGSNVIDLVERWPEKETGRQLVAAEHFLDADPGVGSGTPTTFDPCESTVELGDLPTANLTPGLHHVGYRARDASGRWSATSWVPLLVEEGDRAIAEVTQWPDSATPPLLARAEYFWDWDPGVGRGAVVPVTNSETWTLGAQDPPFAVDASALGLGTHLLGFRIRDLGGRWGSTIWLPVQVEGGEQVIADVRSWPDAEADSMLSGAEAFWDVDPGIGAGRQLPVAAGQTIARLPAELPAWLLDLPSTSSLGVHRVGLRVRDAHYRWSDVLWAPLMFDREPALATAAIPGSGTNIAAMTFAAIGDWNGDQLPDLYAAHSDGLSDMYYFQHSDGFARIVASPLTSRFGVRGGAWADYDNDGRLDIALAAGDQPNPGQSQVFHSVPGDGFEALGATMIALPESGATSCAWADLDRDGWADLVMTVPDADRVRIYRNLGTGAFADISDQAAWLCAGARSVAIGDSDRDGWPDALVTGRDGIHVFHNLQGLRFEEASLPESAREEGCRGAAWLDADNDGDWDFVVISSTHGAALFRNQGGSFLEAQPEVFRHEGRQSLAATTVDLDGDGWVDIVMTASGSPPLMFHNQRDGTFASPAPLPLAAEGSTPGTVVWGDWNRDGTPDLLLAQASGGALIYTNSLGNTRWLRVRPHSVSSNRSALGARISVLATLDGRSFWQTHEIVAGNGTGGQDEPSTLFGLGDAQEATLVRIDWPSGLRTEIRNVTLNRDLDIDEIAQGSPVVRVNGLFEADNTHEFVSRDPVTVTLSSEFPGGHIHYTLDGSPADLRSSLYTQPVEVRPPSVIRATAYSAGYLDYAEAAPVQLVFIPSYTLAAVTDGGGQITVEPLASVYPSNSVVRLTARAAPGWTFLRWEGDAPGTSTNISVTMNSEKTVRAVFGAPLATSVTGGGASGTVITEPEAGPYPFGSLVRLMAIPNAGRSFVQWNTDPTLTNALLTVAVTNASARCNAVFGNVPAGAHNLVLKVKGQGTIQSQPPGGSQPAGTRVTLQPLPDPDWVFDSWSGDVTGTNAPTELTLTAPMTVTATFRRDLRFTAPSLVVEPLDLTGMAGQPAELSATAIGSAPLRYSWEHQGELISGGMAPVLGFAPLRLGDAGDYRLIVSNDYGSITSRMAHVTVTRPPNAAPVVVMRSPAASDILRYPTNILVSALAVDPDGAIDHVEFFADGTRLGLAAPLDEAGMFGFTWTNASPGLHTIFARAYDSDSAVTLAVPIDATVLSPQVTRFSWTQPAYATTEASNTVTLKVVKAGFAVGSVSYSTRSRSASVGRDYIESSGRLDFEAFEQEKTVVVPLLNEFVADGTKTFEVLLSSPSGGTELGAPDVAIVTIADDDNGSEYASLLEFQPSASRASPPGQLTVTTTPAAANGQWRLDFERTWRTSGTTLTNLDPGSYMIEFRPAVGYYPPPRTRATITSAQTTPIVADYESAPQMTAGSVRVDLGPGTAMDAGVPLRWRVVGDGPWHTSGQIAFALASGQQFIEFAPVDGWIAPPPVSVAIYPEVISVAQADYTPLPAPLPGAARPFPIASYNAIRDAQSDALARVPLPMTGQIRTPAGYGSGVVVRHRVVLTAAHVLFNEATGNYVDPATIEWFGERQAGPAGYEPAPLRARGFYVPDEYLTARIAERQQQGWQPGRSTPLSQQWDVAAVYFEEPVARGGQSGYLVSTAVDSEWLTAGSASTITGYPFGTGSEGRMHRTEVGNYHFIHVPGTTTTYASDLVYSLPGNSGGPLLIAHNRAPAGAPADNIFFPAGVYLGSQDGLALVRVIDPLAVTLINRAASSAALGLNFGFGGITSVGSGGAPPAVFGGLRIRLTPTTAASQGGWRLAGSTGSTYSHDGDTYFGPSGTTTFEFKPVTGLKTPQPLAANVPANATNEVIVTYTADGLLFPSVPDQALDEGTTLRITLQASAPSPLFGLVSGPSGLTVTTAGVLSWTPSEAQGPSTNVVKVSASDGSLSVTNQFQVIVREVNAAPLLAAQPNRTIPELTALVVTNTATDSDLPLQSLTYSLITPPSGASIDGNGVIRWTPSESQGPGVFTLTTVVSDGLMSATNLFTVTVQDVPMSAPRLVAPTLTGSGMLRFEVDAPPGAILRIESSTDLDRWSTVTTLTTPASFERPAEAPLLFFRAVRTR